MFAFGKSNFQLNKFRLVNLFLATICAGTMYSNYVSVDVVSENSARSSIGGNVFEYKSEGNKLSAYKNGELIGNLPLKMKFKSGKKLLQPTAIIVAGKVVAAGIAAAAAGGSFGATVAAELGAILGAAGTGAMAGAAAVAEPVGAGAVAATLGGAGEAAAAAAAADAALVGGGAAAAAAVIGPVLVAAGVCGGLA